MKYRRKVNDFRRNNAEIVLSDEMEIPRMEIVTLVLPFTFLMAIQQSYVLLKCVTSHTLNVKIAT